MNSPVCCPPALAVGDCLLFFERLLDRLPIAAAGGCIEAFIRILKQLELMICYRHFFAEEYACSTASSEIGISRLQRERLARETSELPASPREIEFLRLVNEKLFPLLDEYLTDDDFDVIAQPQTVPIPCIGWAFDYEADLEGYSFPYRLALTLILDAIEPDEEVRHFAESLVPGCLSASAHWSLFQTACTALGGHYIDIPELFDSLTAGTGNFWIDYTPDICADNIAWTIEHLDYLHTQFRECEAIIARVSAAAEWLGEDPERWQPVLEAWVLAGHSQPKKKRSP
ncbi:hypothetical protein [Gloeobacter kilaueensis]|uniref:Uncharacterized protein n=1 Tax=Gloeobacter kilaueensis (strain ATCC BAA-2537 / CCAP 1431/1 / ULC 316 / JS1) TaxID=1183438 RepID=U5QGJ6_GLOK1|nr:hypothetical protein [Gloeobacter kilaueensis]AGY57993.1 hypothetical protein GKIL_1747 [Gloeobacter kilaueensis JS1]